MIWTSLDRARDIPEGWDQIAGANIFLTRAFLCHLESVNPCQQRYHLLTDQGSVKAVYVDYSLKLNIFTFSILNLRLPVRIMGIPCSLSKQGFSVSAGCESVLVAHFMQGKGARLRLNCEVVLPGNKGYTLPSCRLLNIWSNFQAYLDSLRSPYRYRINKGRRRWGEVAIELLSPDRFDPEMYGQYEQVYAKSSAKLEKQALEFFQQMPLPAKILKASYAGTLLGFVFLVENGQELIFLFTGFDYGLNERFDTYQNLLVEIVRYGTEKGFRILDFGQTAEETKLKLGCKLSERGMYINHANPVVNFLANKSISLLSYDTPNLKYRVFRNS